MDSAALLSQYGPYAGAAIYCFLGGFIPIFNIEAFLVFLSAGTETGQHWFLLALVTVTAHMAGKSLLYAAGRGASCALSASRRARVESVERRLQQWRFGPSAFVFASAGLGFPPFYAVALMAGTLRLGFRRFLLPGFAGRFLRFAALLLFPQAALRLFHTL
jgi:membrane protein YqaA with SNARE-associated domain